jgi:uncharacterized protein (TIGR02145 family)
MKKLTTLIFLSAVTIISCSKKTETPTKSTINTSVTIKDSVKIGTQIWSAVNYNGDGGVNYSGSTNDPTYGKLYTIAEATTLTLPKGWRIPTTDDFNKLMATEGATTKDVNGYYVTSIDVAVKLMSKTGWDLTQGSNSSGFNAYPGGYYNEENTPGKNVLKGSAAAFITTSKLLGVSGMQANFYIYETQMPNYILIASVFSDQVGGVSDRGSLRFVRDN